MNTARDQIHKPSIAYWRDHSAGASRRRVTPIPQGNRPSTAACTSLGARKASEIVILTCRTAYREYDWNGGGRRLGRQRRRNRAREEHGHSPANEISCHHRQAIVSAFLVPTIFD